MDLTPVDLLLDLRRRGVFLRLDQGRIGFPAGSLRPEDVRQLREAKDVLVALLQAETENEPIPSGPCYCCRGCRYWFSVHRHWTCGTCHPAASVGLVLTWHEADREAALAVVAEGLDVAHEEAVQVAERPLAGPARAPACPACGGRHLYRTLGGDVLCGDCHVPQTTEEVVEWIGVGLSEEAG